MDLKLISEEINELLEVRRKELELTFIEDQHTYYMKDTNGVLRKTFPSVSKVVKKFYGVDSESGLAFFETHKKADVYHRQECEVLLDNLSKEDQAKAETAAIKTAKHLWNFLSGIAQKHNLSVQAAA